MSTYGGTYGGGFQIPIPDMTVHKCAGITQDPVRIPQYLMDQILSPGKQYVGGTASFGTVAKPPARYTSASKSNTPEKYQIPPIGKEQFDKIMQKIKETQKMPNGIYVDPRNYGATTLDGKVWQWGAGSNLQSYREAQKAGQGGQPGGYGGGNAQINLPEYQGYNPYQGGGELGGNLSQLAGYGKGLMDPNSDYYKQLSAQMQQQIGNQAQAQQRASALRGAWSGLGGGASPEQMATSADIAQAGLGAQGQAEANLALQAPQIGAGMLQSTFSPMLGQAQLGEQSRQFGAGLGEQARQYGGNLALQQQQFAGQQAWQQAQLQAQQQQAMMDQLMRQYSMMFGMF